MQNFFSSRSQGADLVAGGVRYRTWAPGKNEMAAVIFERTGAEVRTIPLTKSEDGYFTGLDERGPRRRSLLLPLRGQGLA